MPDLRTLRHRRGLTIFEVAQRSGLTARAIAELELGIRPIDTAERQALARAYEIAPEDVHASQAVLASHSWQYLARILSRQLILAVLVSIFMATMLFGEAAYGAQSHTPVSSASPVAQAAILGRHLSRPYLFTPTTSSSDTSQAALSREEGASSAVVPTTTPTATRSVPSVIPRATHLAAPQSAPTNVPDPVPPDVPSLTWAATPELTPTDTSSLQPTEIPSVIPTEAPDPVPTDVLSPAPTEAPSSTPPEVPSPTLEAPSPTPEAPSPTPEAPSPTPEAPSPTPETPSPVAPDAPGPSGAADPQENSVFMPLPAGGSFHQNVVAALEANNGALQHVVIPLDATWSFNRSIGDPNLLQLDSVYGVYGGGWCDLASRYLMVLRPLLSPQSFAYIRHIDSTGFGLEGVSDDDAVVIWNSNGGGGDQDLQIHNTSGRTITIQVTLVADGVQFQARLE